MERWVRRLGVVRRGQMLRWFVLAGVAVAGLGLAALTMEDFWRPGTAAYELVLTPVTRQDVEIIISERGTLEAGRSDDLICEVAARSPGSPATTIKWIIPEGTYVKAGQLVCELDSAALEDAVRAQRIKVEQAKAALTKAEADLEIVRSQNESDIDAAQRAVQLAELDLKKYLEGDYAKEKRTIQGNILIAQEELRRAEERLAYTERLYKKGFVSATDVEADRLAVTRARNTLEMAQEELRVLEQYTKPRQVTQLQGALDEAKRALQRVQTQARAKEAQALDTLLAQKATYETELATLNNYERQLKKCKLYAPRDGMVVYANERADWRRMEVQIEEGASVREGQKIIQIPDLQSMQVNVKVHEAKISYVRPGQPAIVRVESRPDRPLKGEVKSVATIADAQGWFTSGVQVFTVIVALQEYFEGLKPGMTANVRILADRVPDALAVPVHAVLDINGHYFCFRKLGDAPPEPVEVELGPSNDRLVVIRKGLNEGDLVVNNLASVVDDETLKALRERTKGRVATDEAMLAEAKQPPTGGSPAASSTSEAPTPGAPTKTGKAGKRGGQGRFALPANGAAYIAQYDKNGDQKVTPDELPEQARAFFGRVDTNGDGSIDQAEADQMIQRMREFQKKLQEGGGQFPGPGGGPSGPGGAVGAGPQGSQ
jgi:HlyD family secretion protein